MRIAGLIIIRDPDPWRSNSAMNNWLSRLLHHNSNELEKIAMALSADVQQLVDAVAANKNGVAAAIQGLTAEAAQITALQAQLAALTPGQPIDAEDLTAIQKAVSDLAETNTALQTAVPAGTTPPPPATPTP